VLHTRWNVFVIVNAIVVVCAGMDEPVGGLLFEAETSLTFSNAITSGPVR
jgi:hypothetical protein